MGRWPMLVGTGLVALTASLLAQAPTERVAFDVASIKPNTNGRPGSWRIGYPSGGRFTANNATLLALIASAYQPIAAFQIVGAPDWLSADRYDIEAKADPPPASFSQMFVMVQTLLASRFHLNVHHETRELPIYALILARRDRRLGPNLNPITVDCAALRAAIATSPSGTRPPCAIGGAEDSLVGGASTMADLARALSNRADRMIIDRTDLKGTFDFDLSWTSDQAAMAAQGGVSPSPNGNAPSLFTALQEQLGLKLEPSRGPVDVLVIDHVEKPAED